MPTATLRLLISLINNNLNFLTIKKLFSILPATVGSLLQTTAKADLDTNVVKEFTVDFSYEHKAYPVNKEGLGIQGKQINKGRIKAHVTHSISKLEKWLAAAEKEQKSKKATKLVAKLKYRNYLHICNFYCTFALNFHTYDGR